MRGQGPRTPEERLQHQRQTNMRATESVGIRHRDKSFKMYIMTSE